MTIEVYQIEDLDLHAVKIRGLAIHFDIESWEERQVPIDFIEEGRSKYESIFQKWEDAVQDHLDFNEPMVKVYEGYYKDCPQLYPTVRNKIRNLLWG